MSLQNPNAFFWKGLFTFLIAFALLSIAVSSQAFQLPFATATDDDDNDGVLDTEDPFQLDPNNGVGHTLPLTYDLTTAGFADPYPTFFGVGFSGIMSNGSDYSTLVDNDSGGNDQIVVDSPVGVFKDIEVNSGDAINATNSQKNGFQFGLDIDDQTKPFTIKVRANGPFLGYDENNYDGNLNFASQGFYIGTGDQDNYLKFVIIDGSSFFHEGGFQTVMEVDGTSVDTQNHNIDEVAGVEILNETYVDLMLSVDPQSGLIQAKYALASDPTTIKALGDPITATGDLLEVIQGRYTIGDPAVASTLAIGLIATSTGNDADPFEAVWEEITITEDLRADLAISPTSLDFGEVPLTEALTQTVTITNTGGVTNANLRIEGITLTGANGSQYTATPSSAFTLMPGESAEVDVAFTPIFADSGLVGTLNIFHDGSNASPQQVSLTGDGIIVPIANIRYRINVGGIELATNPVWSEDGSANPSPYRVSGSNNIFNGDNGLAHPGDIDMTHPSIPFGTPSDVFNIERYDEAGGDEMKWEFPVEIGEEYEIRLYMSELFGTIVSDTERVFDVSLEGSVPAEFDDLDAIALAGGVKRGVVVTTTYTAADTTLDLEFIHGTENPSIKGIEVIEIINVMAVMITNPRNGAVFNTDSLDIDFQWASANTLSNDDLVNIYVNTTNEAEAIKGQPLTGSYSVNGLTEGSHYFMVNITDKDGMEYIDADPDEYASSSYRVDFMVTAPPVITITSPVSGTVTNTDTVTLNWGSLNTELGDSVQLRTDTGITVTGQLLNGSYTFNGLVNGTYTFFAEVVDSGSSVRASDEIVVEVSVPNATSTPSPTPNPNSTPTPTPTDVCSIDDCVYIPVVIKASDG